ncbi:MAG: VCBS repeat-containing protein [Armatimonadota bacterium]|nr:VCBS repeat-containing protein [Armatimonadota bacterium]
MRRWLFLCVVALCTTAAASEITQLKPLYPRTELIVGGEARCAIVTPERDDLGPLAEQLADRLEDVGGDRPAIVSADAVVSDHWELDVELIAGRTLVALGNINTNRLLSVLWGMGHACADSVFPGEGGHVIRTVHDPFAGIPGGEGINVLVLAGSDAAGVERAVDVFTERYLPDGGDIALQQPVVDIEFTPEHHRFYPPVDHWLSSKRQPQYSTMEWFRRYLQDQGLMDEDGAILRRDEGTLVNVTGPIARIAQTWFWTGNPELPPLMKQILDRNRQLLANVPSRVEMEAASAAHVPWWDIVEELPLWTDQDRLDVTNALLADALQGHERRSAHEMVKEGYVQVVDHNHGTNSALNSWTAWQYFDRYYDLPETQYWMSVASAIFAGQCASHQILEDAAGYLCYAPADAMIYALGSRDLTYFERGVARTQAEFIAQACVSNLGLSTGFGDTPSLVYPGVFQAISRAGWFYRDRDILWVAYNVLHQNCGLRVFQSNLPVDLSVPDGPPQQWTGMRKLPIYAQTLGSGEGSKELVYDPKESAGEQWFNKIVFRETWDPEAQYLILDGCGSFHEFEGYPNGPSGHRHNDINTIPCFTDVGRMWLVDHTYGARAIKDHSGLYITRDGALSYQDRQAKLMDFAEGDRLALCRSVYEDYSGATWERSIIWRVGDWFVILDRAIAQEPGTYVVRCSLRGLGEHELRDGRLRLEQEGRFCHLITDGLGELAVELFQQPSADHWESFYPHAEPVARVLQQDRAAALEPGESIGFANVVAASEDEATLSAVRVQRTSERAAIVESPSGAMVCGLGELPGGLGEANLWAVARDEVLLAGATRLGELSAQQPVDVSMARDGQPRIDGELQGDVRGALQRMMGEVLDAARRMAAAWQPPDEGLAEADLPALDGESIDLGTPVAALTEADLDADGAPEWIVAGAEGVTALHGNGARLWQFATERPCLSLDAADLDGDGRAEVVAGCEDTNVYALSAAGEELWRFECKAGTASLVRAPAPEMIRIADLQGDGTLEIIVGANFTHCLSPSGEVLWEHYLRFSRGRICGDFNTGLIADVDADGQLEVVSLYRDSYHKGVVYSPEGEMEIPSEGYGFNTVLPLDAAVTNLYGRDEGLHIIVGGDTRFYKYWGYGQFAGQAAGRKSGCFPHLAVWEPEGGKPVLYTATDMGAVLAWRNDEERTDQWLKLEQLWSCVVGERITALGVVETGAEPMLLVGTRGGATWLIDGLSGHAVARGEPTGSPVVHITAEDEGAVVTHADGRLERLPLD